MIRRLILALALLLPLAAAADVPRVLGYQGRLLKADGTPESGVVSVTFKLFDAETGGTALWTEPQQLGLTDGYYATFLGQTVPFPDGAFDGERFLEMSIGTETLAPRQKYGSVAFALSADRARDAIGGRVDATSIAIKGTPVFDAQGQLLPEAGAAFAAKAHGHAAADVTSGVFPLDRLPHGAGSGLDADLLDGSHADAFARRDALAASGAVNDANNPVDWTMLKNVPADLADAKDDGLLAVAHDRTLTGDGASVPLGIDLNAVQARISGACGDGFVVRGINADGTVTCAADADSGGTVKGLTATGPLKATAGTNPTLSLTDACAAGEVLKWDGTTWACAGDLDTQLTAGAGLEIANGAVSLGACPAGKVWKSLGTGWACADDADTRYAAGAGLALTGTTFAIRTDCAAGEVLKWDGTTWACAADADAGGTVTSVSATGPLTSSGGRTPTIAISKADATTPGYLAAADFSAFSAKLGGATTGGGLAVTGTTIGLTTACAAGELLKWNGAAWACAADVDTRYSAGKGLALSGTAFSLLTTCAAGELLKWDGADWACASDVDTDTTYSAGKGLALSGTTFSLPTGCAAGELLKWDGADWACAADVDTNTTYSAGKGLALSGTTFSLPTTCAAGELLKWDGTDWACAADVDTDTDTTYSAGKGLALSGTTFSLPTGCAAGELLKWDGTDWACAADVDTDTDTTYSAGKGLALSGTTFSLPTGCAAGELLKWDGADWACAADVDTDTNTTYSAGKGLALSGTTFSLPTVCAAGEMLKWNGTDWACASDVDTTYTAGDGLALSGTTFSLPTGCAAGEILKWTGAAWVCAPDDDAGGTVTSVGAAGPLVSSGGRTPVISLPAAGASRAGYLTAADWNVFDNKVGSVGATGPLVSSGGPSPVLSLPPATSTADGYLTAADYADFSSRLARVSVLAPLRSSGGLSPVLSLPAATAAADGYLAATDFAAFNGKVASVAASGALASTGGTTPTITLKPCGTGEILKFLGGAWTCAADQNAGGTVTAVTAAGPLASSGGTTPNLTISQASATADGYLAKGDFGAFAAKVGSVAATGPLASSGGISPTISIAQAGSATDGYLSKTDWGTFNGKVSSVSATGPLASSGGTTPTITIAQAGSATDGYLSKTDWAAFNAKVGSVTAGAGITIGGTATAPTVSVTSQLGTSPSSALASCNALYTAGVRLSGRYYINPSGSNAYTVWCDMETNGGGWTMVYNSVLGIDTLSFWYIPYAERLNSRGTPDIATNHYNGDVYRYGRTYMDVIEDLRGKQVIAFTATTTGIDTTTMKMGSPTLLSGNGSIYGDHFAGGWAAPDGDFDSYSGNCATAYVNVTQHYTSCWTYNLGADADAPNADGNVGPHLYSGTASTLGLAGDGTNYTRVRRITRYAKW